MNFLSRNGVGILFSLCILGCFGAHALMSSTVKDMHCLTLKMSLEYKIESAGRQMEEDCQEDPLCLLNLLNFMENMDTYNNQVLRVEGCK